MDPKRRSEIRVGLAVLISIVIIVGGIMWGKGFSLRSKRYLIEVVFDNVGGLDKGANVLANGVNRGRVKDIRLAEGKVWVRAAVDKSVTIYSDYHITIESPTVMAGKALSINPGERLPPADITVPLHGDNPLGMTEAVATVEEISRDVRVVLGDLDSLLVNLNRVAGDSMTRYNITSTFADVASLAHQSDRWMKDNRDRLTGTLTELEQTLAATRQMLQTTGDRLNGTLAGADTAAQSVAALADEFRTLGARLNAQQGTMGKLMGDEELYNRLNHAIAEVDSLARSIRKNGMKQRIVLF